MSGRRVDQRGAMDVVPRSTPATSGSARRAPGRPTRTGRGFKTTGRTLTGPEMRARHASRTPLPAFRCSTLFIVGQASSPDVTRTPHEPHTPRPPHGAAMTMPASRAASETVAPGDTHTVIPAGSNVTGTGWSTGVPTRRRRRPCHATSAGRPSRGREDASPSGSRRARC